ncbi:uncharacterized membrane protein YhhN [Jatrophihabitans sp. GAS493]|uniref:lysoplasmalogenase n=1 Tax=Jatrophihabitans sp. GAS493 TaxID=1907575 RepID=UPI000BBF6458|nr:lysoplasmalogenase [Jatrophihabitans sp. GAS493]SOD70398.1 uncharacterized membrane protein YhhN [Jatrophihabitans sp. GAS493]
MNRGRRLGLFALLAAADTALAATPPGAPARRWRRLTKPLLMPTLALQVPDSQQPRLIGSALVLSTAGDTALLATTEPAFAAGLGSFLLAHCAYIAALARLENRDGSTGWAGLRRRPGLALPAAGLATTVSLTLARRAGPMRMPVTGYGAIIASMFAVALGTGRPRVIAGATLFCLSDLIIAIDRFGRPIPRSDALVMATYTAGQALLISGCTATADPNPTSR